MSKNMNNKVRCDLIANALLSRQGRKRLAMAMVAPIRGGATVVPPCETCAYSGCVDICECRAGECWIPAGLFEPRDEREYELDR